MYRVIVTKSEIHLIYLNHINDFPFRQELDK